MKSSGAAKFRKIITLNTVLHLKVLSRHQGYHGKVAAVAETQDALYHYPSDERRYCPAG